MFSKGDLDAQIFNCFININVSSLNNNTIFIDKLKRCSNEYYCLLLSALHLLNKCDFYRLTLSVIFFLTKKILLCNLFLTLKKDLSCYLVLVKWMFNNEILN